MGKIIIVILSLFVFLLEIGYCELSSKFDNFMVNIRHAKKKDHTNRDVYSNTFSYEYDYYAWISSTEDTTTYETTTDYSYSTQDTQDTQYTQETTTEDLDYVTSISETTVDEPAIFDVKEDVMTKFLRIVEDQRELGENCTAGTDLSLGEGVVDRYAQVGKNSRLFFLRKKKSLKIFRIALSRKITPSGKSKFITHHQRINEI